MSQPREIWHFNILQLPILQKPMDPMGSHGCTSQEISSINFSCLIRAFASAESSSGKRASHIMPYESSWKMRMLHDVSTSVYFGVGFPGFSCRMPPRVRGHYSTLMYIVGIRHINPIKDPRRKPKQCATGPVTAKKGLRRAQLTKFCLQRSLQHQHPVQSYTVRCVCVYIYIYVLNCGFYCGVWDPQDSRPRKAHVQRTWSARWHRHGPVDSSPSPSPPRCWQSPAWGPVGFAATQSIPMESW